MKECETCIYNPIKEKTLCCAANELGEAVVRALQIVPFFGDYVGKYVCRAYERVMQYGSFGESTNAD